MNMYLCSTPGSIEVKRFLVKPGCDGDVYGLFKERVYGTNFGSHQSG